MHPADLQATVTNAKDFKAAKLKANYSQTVNLVINGSSELDSKLKQFKDTQLYNPETNQQSTLTSNIPPATITKNESLDAIFPFELKELSATPLFSGAALKKKLITTMYTDVKIDDFPIEVNSIIVPIKVLIMEAIQYQALISNDWLSKTKATFDWNMQELQLSQNSQHTQVPATCGHFKTHNMPAFFIEFEKKEKKSTWETYQVLWADKDYNKLSLVFSWDNNGKRKKREELTTTRKS
ncbi:hypothetical protein G9A89_008043 [Geosiphon pyriformis]|nr:hypothetical protein G9A89_008043 [Geosiphon pyriformis]